MPSSRLAVFGTSLAMLIGSPQAGAAQDSAAARLQSRLVYLSPASTQRFLRALRETSAPHLHGLAYLRRQPTPRERVALDRRGVRVLAPIRGRIYRVRVAKGVSLSDRALATGVRWFAPLEPADRVVPDIWANRYDAYRDVLPSGDTTNTVLRPDGTLSLTVLFQQGVPLEEARSVLLGVAPRPRRISDRVWEAVVTRAGLETLSGLDIVQWISAGPPLYRGDNERSRQVIRVDELQDFDVTTGVGTGFTGAGVQVGVFDTGIDQDHGDFGIPGTTTSRFLLAKAAKTWHGTMVAGIIGGNGAMSDKSDSWGVANAWSPYQWRGMAPAVGLLESLAEDGGFLSVSLVEYKELITNFGMDISNHSYTFDLASSYGDRSALYDEVIRGDHWIDSATIRPRLMVFSTGNAGWGTRPENGYFSLTKAPKNGLIVGAWDATSSGDRLDSTSSLGPTQDGRLKPDIVAPGDSIRSAGYYLPGMLAYGCTVVPFGTTAGATERRSFYGKDCGSSLAAAVATGALALVLEAYAQSFTVNIDQLPPLPSTLRGLVVHSARDLSGPVWYTNADGPVQALPGPDFATGFGLLDVAAAVQLVRERRVIEDTVPATCDVRTFSFAIHTPAGATEPDSVRITLAWDDLADDPASGSETEPRLRNDLDLVLIDPAGQRWYPFAPDQRVTDAGGNTIAPDAQTCGMQLGTDFRIERQLHGDAPVTTAALVPAGRGRDHLNNLEQVRAKGLSGTWQAEVGGFNVELGPQRFSLIGIPRGIRVRFEPLNLCKKFPGLCDNRLQLLCTRYPQLCKKPQFTPIDTRAITIQFHERDVPVILPFREMCVARHGPSGCPPSTSRPYEIVLGTSPAPLPVELWQSDGAVIARGETGRAPPRLRLRATPPPDGELFLAIFPGPDTPLNRPLRVELEIRRR